jgi:hypothetical protein
LDPVTDLQDFGVLVDLGVVDLRRAQVVDHEQPHLVLRRSSVRIFENLPKMVLGFDRFG